MAGRVISIRVDGVELLVEATPVVGSELTSKLDRAQDAVTDAFGRAREAIVAVATSTVAAIEQLGERAVRPDQVEIKFGVKFSVQGNVVLANASGEANLEVKLQYNKPFPTGGVSGQ